MTKEQLKDMIEVTVKTNGSQSITGSVLQDTFISIVDNLAHDEATIYTDVRAYGAKGDGVDKGIGNYEGDHDAINAALLAKKKVMLKGGVFIVKKPIVLRSNSELYIDSSATLKLGDGANCTLIKNEHIDIPHDGINPVSYPSNFKRNKNIRIYGGGAIDGNGLKQNRSNSTVTGDRPDVIGTEIFKDGDTRNYFGALMKFADVDNLVVENITIKNPRTYAIAAGGLMNYVFRNIIMERAYNIENGDGIHLHGHCYNGLIENISGQSGDDFVAVTTSEASQLSIRVGDVIGLRIKNLYNYGVPSGATPSAPLDITNGIPPKTRTSRCVRLTYTDHVIDEVFIENIRGYNANFMSQVVMSYLHLPDFSGTNGKIGNVFIDGIIDKNGTTPISVGANTKVDYISLKNVYYEMEDTTEIPALLRQTDNFGTPDQWELTEIGTVVMDNIYILKGNTLYDAQEGLIWMIGEVENVFINNLIVENKAGATSFNALVGGPVKNLTISNSKVNVKYIISPVNGVANMSFKEVNCDLKDNGLDIGLGFEIQRVSSESILIYYTPTAPKRGDKILKPDALWFFTGTWIKLGE